MAKKWGKYTVAGVRIARTLDGDSPISDPTMGAYLQRPPGGQYDILKLGANYLTVLDVLTRNL
jgi:hypothetical protein